MHGYEAVVWFTQAPDPALHTEAVHTGWKGLCHQCHLGPYRLSGDKWMERTFVGQPGLHLDLGLTAPSTSTFGSFQHPFWTQNEGTNLDKL